MKNKVNFNFVKGTYNHEAVSKHYIEIVDKVGMWESEKIIIKKYFSKNERIIDFACGAGRTTFDFHILGYNVEGYDLSDVLINAARKIAVTKEKNIQFTVGNMVETGFEKESVDGCFISDSGLMQVPGVLNRIKTLKEMYRILKNNKFLIFCTPEDRSAVNYTKSFWDEQKELWNRKKYDNRLIDFGDRIFLENGVVENYAHFPSNQEIVDCIEQAGFKFCDNVSRTDICDEDIKQTGLNELQFWVTQKREKVGNNNNK